MGKSAIESKEIPTIAFIGDEIAGRKITKLQHGAKYGSSIYLSDGRVVPLHDFEKNFKLKVKDRTREDERNKLKYRMLLNQLEDGGYFIHRGELAKFTKANYPVLISDRYYDKNAIPFSEKNELDKYKRYSDERFNSFYISKKEDEKYTPDYVDFYKKTHSLIPYLDYLVKMDFLIEPKDSDIVLPKLYVEPEHDKKLRLKWEEYENIKKLINIKSNGLISQYGFEEFKNRFKDRFDIAEIEKLLSDKERVYSKIQKIGKDKPTMKFGGVVDAKHSQLGSAKELSIIPTIREHDMIAECGDCGDKFSYQNLKKHILWGCPKCESIKRIS
jgi:hypothetical protein